MTDLDRPALDAERQRDAAQIRSTATTLITALTALKEQLEDQRAVQAERHSMAAATSFDNAIAKLDRVQIEPPRVFWRLFRLSHATISRVSTVA